MRTKKPASNPKHDAIVRNLADLVRSEDRYVLMEHEYKNNGDHEADILAINFNRSVAHAYEIKKTNHYKGRKKARQQLDADEKYLKRNWDIKKVYKFYVHGNKRNNGTYKIHLIKP